MQMQTLITTDDLRCLGACQEAVGWLEEQSGQVDAATLDPSTIPPGWIDWILPRAFGEPQYATLWERAGWRVLPETGEYSISDGEKAVSFAGSPVVTVESGGRQRSCGQSSPVVTVESGGRQHSYGQSSPVITVKSDGWQWSHDQSSPVVTVESGGWQWSYDQSSPVVTVADGGQKGNVLV